MAFPLCRPAKKAACTSLTVNTKRQEATNSRINARQFADKVVLSVLRSRTRSRTSGSSNHYRVHWHFTSRVPPSFVRKVRTGRGCKIRSGTLDRKRSEISSETGTHAFVSSTKDSNSFLSPSATSCLPSFVCQWGSVRSSSLCFPCADNTGTSSDMSSSFGFTEASRCRAQGRTTSPGEKAGRIYDSSKHLR